MRRKKIITPEDGYYFAEKRRHVEKRKKSRIGCLFFTIIIVALAYNARNIADFLDIDIDILSILYSENINQEQSISSTPTTSVTATPSPTPSPTPVPITVEIQNSDYHYWQLDETSQEVYTLLYQCVNDFQESVDISQYSIDGTELEKIFTSFRLDQCDVFWLKSSYTYMADDETYVVSSIIPNYAFTEVESTEYQELLEQKIKDILTLCENYESDYEKALFLYEYIIQNTQYNLEVAQNIFIDDSKDFYICQNLLGVILYGEGICSGYAQAYSYLLNAVGIDAFCVSGTADNVSHQWNLIYLQGSPYYVDTTWGDPVSTDSSEGYINYNYFAMTSEELFKTHSTTFDYPICDQTEYNYYVYNNIYFTNYSKEDIALAIETAILNGEESVILKFSDTDVYTETLYQLTENDECFDILADFSNYVKSDRYNYSFSEISLTIEIKFEYIS